MIQERQRSYPGSVIEFWRIRGDDNLKAGIAYTYTSRPYVAGPPGTEVYVNAAIYGFIMLRGGSSGSYETINIILERLAGTDINNNIVWITISSIYTSPPSGGDTWGEPVSISLSRGTTAGTYRIRIVCSSPSANRQFYINLSLEGASSKPIPATRL